MNSPRSNAWMSLPSKCSEPDVGRSRHRSSFASVVLPDPDSPTMPSVSPSARRTLTPSTALTYPRIRPMAPVTGKCFFRPTPSSISESRPDIAHRCRCSHPAGGDVTAVHGHRSGEGLPADRLPFGTSRSERAARRQPGQVGRLSPDLDELVTSELGIRQAAQEGPSIRMGRIVEDLPGAAHLHDLP